MGYFLIERDLSLQISGYPQVFALSGHSFWLSGFGCFATYLKWSAPIIATWVSGHFILGKV